LKKPQLKNPSEETLVGKRTVLWSSRTTG